MIKIFLLITFWIVLLSAAYAGVSAAPWVPTKSKQKRQIINSIDFKDGDTVYDLGCGTGTLLFETIKKNPNIHAVGIELSIVPYLVAKIRSIFYKNVEIKFGNLFKKDISNANIVFIFLLSKSYPKLIKKLKVDLNPNTTIVVEAWPLQNIEPEKIIKEDNLLPVYIYKASAL